MNTLYTEETSFALNMQRLFPLQSKENGKFITLTTLQSHKGLVLCWQINKTRVRVTLVQN